MGHCLVNYRKLLLIVIVVSGCTYYPVLKMPDILPRVLKQYERFDFPVKYHLVQAQDVKKKGYFYKSYRINGMKDSYRVPSTGNTMFTTNIMIDEGDLFTVISSHHEAIMIAIGEKEPEIPASYFVKAQRSGDLRLGILQVHSGASLNTRIDMDIFIWREAKFREIEDFFKHLKRINPRHRQIDYILEEIDFRNNQKRG